MRPAPRTACALGLALLALRAGADSDTQYVIEQLAVSVAASPDGSGDHIATLHSGDAVQVLEREADHVHVRLGSGAEGWIKSGYLTAGPPLRQQLKERTQERDELKQRLTQLEADLEKARAAHAAHPAEPEPAAEPHPADAPLFSGVGGAAYRPGWAWVAGAAVLALAVGFGVGWQLLDRRIRSKYGGLRIY